MFQVIKDVGLFQGMAGIQQPTVPRLPSDFVRDLRVRLLAEEINELCEAVDHNDMEGIADNIADSIYILVGTALVYGIPLREVWNEVQRANMDKFPGGVCRKRDDGKIIKPDNWQPPNIAKILKLYGYEK